MSNQLDPNNYSLMCRCRLQDAAAIRDLATQNGKTMSAFVADLVHEAAKGVELTPNARKWMHRRFVANKKIRAKADRETAQGRYRIRQDVKP